ncbi:hypothetical protein GC105_11520 [Alkalibaculum sp. M08DMB]|uniref:RNA polymerase sigma-70 region 4 domain-containing protein n=1 Tax=Alkalibaculum sporogenes TaxID=2655001 RepID=A0A6A7KA80_9FIRM|nr:hypothetical protein [Alkalibaculum sporogenes]MPW26418.1 hypothetical protein [Alkalibaculum sporogenes]
MTKVDSNYKKTEKALYDYKFLKGYIELRKKDLAELDYQGVSATRLSLAKSDNRKISDPVGDEFESLERIKETWGKEIKIKENVISSIDYAISLLDDGERKIVEMKYKKCIRYKDIASFLGYSERQIIRINKRIIEKVGIVLFGIE